MKPSIKQYAVHVIGDRVGLAVHAQIHSDGDGKYLEVRPLDGHPNESFSVQLRFGYRSAEVKFIPGRFSAGLIVAMGSCSEEAKQIFAAFVSGVRTRKDRVLMRINGLEVFPSESALWPKNWTQLDLSLKKTPLLVDQESEVELEGLVLSMVVPMFGMLAALIGVEEQELITSGEPEGKAIQTLSTRYERKKINREACIQLKGCSCYACGFDFAEAYGPLGLGYIEIHHLTPISKIGADYKIDVVNDLVPLCSNCHSMAHREEPPVPIDRLRKLVGARTSNRGEKFRP